MHAYPPFLFLPLSLSAIPRLFACLLRILPIGHVSFSSAHSHVPIIINGDKSFLILLEAQMNPKSGKDPNETLWKMKPFFPSLCDLGRPL